MSVSVLQTRGVACKNPFIVGKVDDMVGYRSKTLKNVVGDPHWENEAFIVGCYRDCEYNGSAITLEVFDQDKQAPEPRRLGVCRVPVARKKELSKIGASEWLPLREDEGDNGGAPLGEICVKVMASPAPRVVFESPLLRKQGLLKFRPVHVVLFEPSLLAIYENATYTNELERVNISEVTSAELRYNEKRITLKLDMGDSGSSSDNSNSSDSSSSSSSSNGNGNGNGGSNSGDPGLLSGLWSKTIDYVFSGGKPYIRNWVKVLRKFCVRAVEDEMRFPIIANALATVAVAANAGSDPNLQQQQQQQQQQHKLQQGPSGATATTVSDGEASAYFGVTLEKLSKCGLCNSDGVPVFVQTLIDTIAARGLRTEGIFRVSGPVMEVSAARRRLDAGGLAGFLRPDEPVHVVSGLLKMFFRELPEPIFTFELYQRFINSVLVVDIEESKREMKAVMAEAPRENMAVLKALVRLLCRVCENCAVNKMTSANLSIIFAPTLVWSDTM